MNKKLLAVAVAATLAPAVSQAQVTLSGDLKAAYEFVSASGATQNGTAGVTNTDVISRHRMQDGNASFIQFRADEDLGNGLKAFLQVRAVPFANLDTRAQNLQPAGAAALGQSTQWGAGNTGIGISSASFGTFTFGIWDIYYNSHIGKFDPTVVTGAGGAAVSSYSLFYNMGATTPGGGNRMNNVVRWDSPNWNGFTLAAAYVRPGDGAVRTPSTAFAGGASNILDGKKQTAWTLQADYSNGPLNLMYAYYKESDLPDAAVAAGTGNHGVNVLAGLSAGVANTTTAAAASAIVAQGAAGAGPTAIASPIASVIQTRGDRVGGSWTFPFGLQVSLVWDRLQYSGQHQQTGALAAGFGVAAGAAGNTFSSDMKRTSWALPLIYKTGKHTAGFTYVRAGSVKGSASLAGANFNGSDMGAKSYSLVYQYALSKRTNVAVQYTKIVNDAMGNYDFFANGVGMSQINRGADPSNFSLALRHTF